MKKILITLVALVSMTAAMAQEHCDKKCNDGKKAGVEMKGEKACAEMKGEKACAGMGCKDGEVPSLEMKVDFMAKTLKLDDGQRAKVMDLHKEFEERMKEVLDEEQFKNYQKMQQAPRHDCKKEGMQRDLKKGEFRPAALPVKKGELRPAAQRAKVGAASSAVKVAK